MKGPVRVMSSDATIYAAPTLPFTHSKHYRSRVVYATVYAAVPADEEGTPAALLGLASTPR